MINEQTLWLPMRNDVVPRKLLDGVATVLSIRKLARSLPRHTAPLAFLAAADGREKQAELSYRTNKAMR